MSEIELNLMDESTQETEQGETVEEVQDAAQPEEPKADPTKELREIVSQQSRQIESLTNQITRLIQGGAQIRSGEAPKQQPQRPSYERFTANPHEGIKALEDMDFSF